MNKIKVLFFAADPLSAHGGRAPRLLLDEDVRQIRQKVRMAQHRDALDFDVRLAARTDDLLQALRETRPRVVHFSGHGETEGLVLVSADGRRAHRVDASALTQLFRLFRGDIGVVVLNACFSLPQAEAIANVVGCAIGTRGAISDDAAITFGGVFYRAVASGESVQAAFDQAQLALAMEHFEDRDCPHLVVRPGVDPSRLVLVAAPDGPQKRWEVVPRRAVAAAAACVITAAIVLDPFRPSTPLELTPSDVACGAEPPARGIRPLAGGLSATSGTPADPAGVAATLANAKAFYQARNYDEAALAFEQAAQAGNGEAMGCLGYMYLSGRGMDPQPATGIEWLRKAARDERDAHGMYALAMAYSNGDGVARAEHWARHWLTEAAELEYAEAMRSLGGLYQARMNDSSNVQALALYRRAVEAGSVDAVVDVGMMYELGLGTARDPAVALRSYRTAAQAGSARGMLAVGQSYEKGVGVRRNYAQARDWYLRAAKAGSAEAMNSIGALYDRGLGIRRSRSRAIRWYVRAAEAGSPLARANLAALGRD